jgi:hypothetical protein
VDELHTQTYGFDFRGPASSEMLNQFAEDLNQNLGSLLAASYRLKHEVTILSNQTLKQSYAYARILNAVSTRDSGTNCKANLTDPTVLLTTDRNGSSINAEQRMVHWQPYGRLSCPVAIQDYLTYSDGERNYVQPGVTMALESGDESGDVYLVPQEYALAGLPGMFYERILDAVAVKPTPQSIRLFFSVPPSRSGSGYHTCNYIKYIPFPAYTEGVKVYYTTDTDPTLTEGGATWNSWLDYSYVDDLHHHGAYFDQQGPILTSFPGLDISAIRIDLAQPYYLVEDGSYVYSSGLGDLGLGLMKSTASTVIGTVRIDKPTGNFAGIGTDHGYVVFSNIDPSEQTSAFYSTYSWVDPSHAHIAYVEVTLRPGVLAGGHVPIIKEVSIDYTT